VRGPPDALFVECAYEDDVRVALLLLVVVVLPGCTINLVRKSGETESLKQRIEYFKWLYQKGFYGSDPAMMKSAASKILDVREREEQPSQLSQIDALERLVRRLEDDVDRLLKEKR
jgi:hypothetical protein